MKTPASDIFFIGFLAKIPVGLRAFLAVACVVLPCLFAGLGFAISATQDDPGDGATRFDVGRQQLTGVVTALPYPTLTITQGTEFLPAGRTVMLSGHPKFGADTARPFDGQLAEVEGWALSRGGLVMVQLNGGQRAPKAAAGDVPPVTDTPLGRWRLTGEICDGKCLAGAMRPGRGLAHKACANLCLIGGIPPVFVSTGEVDGETFLLVAGPEGGPMPGHLLDVTSVLIEAEGEIHRRGDLLIFRLDPDTVRVL